MHPRLLWSKGIFFMITIFYMNEYISILSEKTSERIFLKKSQKERKKRKKPRAWVKLYNGYFSPLTLFFLPVIFVLLTQSFMTRALTWINLNQPLKFLLLHHCAQAKKNERQIRIVTSVVFGCFPPTQSFFHHMHKRVLINSFPFEDSEINLFKKQNICSILKEDSMKERREKEWQSPQARECFKHTVKQRHPSTV